VHPADRSVNQELTEKEAKNERYGASELRNYANTPASHENLPTTFDRRSTASIGPISSQRGQILEF
jgi:hypothetical protein